MAKYRVTLASGVVRLLEENLTADHTGRPTCVEGATLHARNCRFRKSMPLCYLGAATDGKNFRPYPALPFSRPLQSKIVFPVSKSQPRFSLSN